MGNLEALVVYVTCYGKEISKTWRYNYYESFTIAVTGTIEFYNIYKLKIIFLPIISHLKGV